MRVKLTKTLLLSSFFFLLILGLKAQNEESHVKYSKGTYLGKSSPLSSWKFKEKKYADVAEKKAAWKKDIKGIPNFGDRGNAVRSHADHILPKNGDPLVKAQTQFSKQKSVADEITILQDYDAIDFDEAQIWPPDCNGDIGLNYYVEGTNGGGGSVIHIYDKNTGELVESATTTPLWAELGTDPVGDIYVYFDRFENRWVIAEITFSSILMAVSESDDPLGSYNAYEFFTQGLPDYPKFGNWDDAYYITTNEFNGFNPIYALDKEDLLTGANDVDIIIFDPIPKWGNGSIETNTPINFEGTILPNENTPFAAFRMYDDEWPGGGQDRLEYYQFTPDFDDPDNSTFDGPFDINLAPFESNLCGYGLFDCLEQPDGSLVSAIHTVIMNKIQYRNFGDYESILLNFSVDVTGSDVAGVRWVELRKESDSSWNLYQEGTMNLEDGVSRFMGTITQDSKGNILLAYSTVSPDQFLGVALTGRRVSDDLGVMSFQETTLIDGQSNNPVARWGDYFSITLDPQNDVTFWLTSEYMPEDTDWATRVTAMSIRRDSIDAQVSAILTPKSGAGLTSAEEVSIRITNPGYKAIENVPYGFMFEGDVIETGVVEEVLEPLESVERTFNTTVDMSALGTYSLKAYTYMEDDENIDNDTIRSFVKNIANIDIETSLAMNPTFSCSEEQDFSAIYTNVGFDTIVSFDAQLYIDDVLTSTIPWEGTLLPNESTTVLFESVMTPTGVSTIRFSLTNPNGGEDQIADNNDAEFEYDKLADGINANLSFQSDGFPTETSWEIVDANGMVIYEGGGYSGINASEDIDLCFEEACYEFRLFDSFGDGWGGSQTAFLELTQDDGIKALVLDNTSFGDLWTQEFCLPVSCDLDVEVEYEDATGPNVDDAAIFINFPAGNEQTMYSIDGGVTFQSSPLFTNLVQGDYDIVVMDSFGCTYEDTINVIVGQKDLESSYSFTINPNPSFGMIRLELEGYDGPNELRATIINMQGQKVSSHQISKYSNGYRSTIFIPNLPNGQYYVSIEDDTFRELKAFIKQ